MNQINDILLEWAMRSPDGLASGAWTDANLTALRESLESRGMSESECNEIMSEIIEFNEADKSPEQIANKNKRLIKKAALSPNATPEQKLEWEKIKKDTEKSKREKDLQPHLLEFTPEMDPKGYYKDFILSKGVEPHLVKMMYSELSKIDEGSRIAFYNLYNESNDVSDSIQKYSNNKKAIIAVNGITTGKSRGALGKGELPFVWFLNNATHGGVGTGDILFGSEIIDIKDYQDGIDIERNSFDNFNTVPFINELSSLIESTKNSDIKIFLKKLLAGEDGNGSELNAFVSNENSIDKNHVGSVRGNTEKFLDKYDMGRFGKTTMAGIRFLGKKIEDIRKKEGDKIGVKSVVSIFSKGEKVSAAVDNIDPIKKVPVGDELKNIDSDGKTVSLHVEPIEAATDDIIISKLLRIQFFRSQWNEVKMWASLAKHLKYTGIILILGKHGENILNEKEIKKGNSGEGFAEAFSFRGISKGIKLTLKNE